MEGGSGKAEKDKGAGGCKGQIKRTRSKAMTTSEGEGGESDGDDKMLVTTLYSLVQYALYRISARRSGTPGNLDR